MASRTERVQSSLTILVVDDSVDDLIMLSALLRTQGYRVLPARDGSEALALLRRERVDLAIVDVVMPDLDGFEFCQQLRSREHTSWLPVILVTAVRSELEDRIRGLDVGADDFLLKPVQRDILQARIRSLLRIKAAGEDLQRDHNRLRVLNYAVARLIGVNSLQELPALTISAALAVAECQQVAFFELDKNGNSLSLLETHGLSEAYQRSFQQLPVGQDSRTAAILEGTRMIGDMQAASGDALYQEWADREGFQALLEVPLRGGERVWGLLALYYEQARAFGEGEVDILVTLAGQVALVIERLHRFALEQRRRQVAESLRRVAQIINATLDPGEVLELILRQLAAVVSYRNAYVLLRQGQELLVAACEGEFESGAVGGRQISLADYSLLQEVLVTGESIVVSRARVDKHVRALPGEAPPASWMSVPLVVRGKAIGLLTISSAHEGTYDREIADIVLLFARQAALAVENARLFQQVQEERRKLEAILEQTTDAVLAVDDEQQILLANPSVQRFLGLPAGPLQGLSLDQVLQHESLQALLNQAGQGLGVTAEVAGLDGKRLYASVSPIAGVGQVVIMQDITPLKELEKMRLQAERAERDRLRQTLSRYLGPDIVDQVLLERHNLLDRRERVDVVITFADIRGFTAAVANLLPETAVEMLNEFFTAMTRIVYKSGGAVIDLIGDELMASFGAPLPCASASERAVETAVSLLMEFNRLHGRWQDLWGVDLGLGVGLDRGQAVMGNVGTAERLSFTLVGNVVNRAHRLVEQAGTGEILLSSRVLEDIHPARCPWGELEEVDEILPGGPERAYCLRL
ncbi:MAG: GAF domain-containing protein [Chloroflexia bacterium]|nr:GAF domain-containing protein [Chloroflexia bacterium]